MSNIHSCTEILDQVCALEADPQIKDNFRRLRSQLFVCLRKAGKEDILVPQIDPKSDSLAAYTIFNESTAKNQHVLQKLIKELFNQLCYSCSCTSGHKPTVFLSKETAPYPPQPKLFRLSNIVCWQTSAAEPLKNQ